MGTDSAVIASRFRLGATADLHLSNRLPHARPGSDGVTDRLRDVLGVMEQIGEYAKKHELDALLLAGDIFDRPMLDAVTLVQSMNAIVALSEIVDVWVLPGNHDTAMARGGQFVPEVYKAINNKHIHYLDEPFIAQPGLNFYPAPYASKDDTLSLLAAYRADLNKTQRNVLLFHNAILGCGHEGWTCDDGFEAGEVCEGFDCVLSGHFHTHQEFGDVGMYLGAPLQHHFGDVGEERGFWDITFRQKGHKDPIVKEFIPTAAPQFHILDWDDTDATHFEAGDYYRIDVEATHAEWTSLRAEVDEFARQQEDTGARITVRHKPIYHHERRMNLEETGERRIDVAVEHYLDAANTDGLDRRRLLRIGRGALDKAR